MTPNCRSRLSFHNDRGFALVIVLWIAALLSVLTAHLSVSIRTQIRVAQNLTESAKAEALADAGISLAVMDLMTARRTSEQASRFPVDGRPVACLVEGNGTLSISVTDEAARIDVNSAGVPLLQALIFGLGEPPDIASKVAEAIYDYRDADDERKANGAESADYRDAGVGWLPKNGPLQSIEELVQVYGMTPDLLNRMRQHVSVHTGQTGIDDSLASAGMIGLLRNGLNGSAGSFGSFPEFDAAVALPAMFLSASSRRFYRLLSVARTVNGSVFVREAVLDLGARQSLQPVFLRWTHGLSAPELSRGADRASSIC